MNKYLTLLVCLIIALSSINAQIDIEISDGMTVETGGSLSIEVSGDVIENGTGYLKGVVTSGSRSAVTSFAGLTLGDPLTGTITRTTGTAYSATAPKTSLRSYELVNSGSALNTDVQSKFISTVTNDERNGIGDPYLFTKVGTTWKGYSDNGSTSSLITAANVDIPANTSNIVISEGIGVGATIYLEGPYQGGATPLADNLGTLPSASPYTTEAPRTASNVPTQAVDWVSVELRSGTAPGTSMGFRSAFVNANGQLIQDDGTVGIGFPAVPGNYHLVIKHRNHLAVMSNLINGFTWISQ
jgi:hypothetical protein